RLIAGGPSGTTRPRLQNCRPAAVAPLVSRSLWRGRGRSRARPRSKIRADGQSVPPHRRQRRQATPCASSVAAADADCEARYASQRRAISFWNMITAGLNSMNGAPDEISYAVFCLKKKKTTEESSIAPNTRMYNATAILYAHVLAY